MRTYAIETTNRRTGTMVSRLSFDSSKEVALDMLSERAEMFDAGHRLELKTGGQVVTDGRCHGYK